MNLDEMEKKFDALEDLVLRFTKAGYYKQEERIERIEKNLSELDVFVKNTWRSSQCDDCGKKDKIIPFKTVCKDLNDSH